MSTKESVLSKTYDVEMEVEIRKYDVPKDRLKALLRKHRNKSIEDIANILNKPITLVAHWFRNDKCFAIPDADIWPRLKELLGIETDEFDKAIMTFETQGGNYDMRNRIYAGDIAPTLMRGSEKNLYMVNVIENHPADSRVKICEDNIFQTLSSRMGTGGGNVPMVEENAVVRRLTPMECERLQGYPDGWTDIGEWVDSKGKKHKDADSPRYKALGNSIALPFWEWMANRMVNHLKQDGTEEPTMASLFDGIGGFPLVYSRCGCKPIWASEIEEFPIAVTKIRFPEDLPSVNPQECVEPTQKHVGNALDMRCDDAISRQAVLDSIEELKKIHFDRVVVLNKVKDKITALPSAEKTGHWIEKEDFNMDTYYDCSECGESFCLIDGTPTDNLYNYCPNCGCRMVEPQESEIHCNCTDAEIAKSFIEDVEAVKDLLPQESEETE